LTSGFKIQIFLSGWGGREQSGGRTRTASATICPPCNISCLQVPYVERATPEELPVGYPCRNISTARRTMPAPDPPTRCCRASLCPGVVLRGCSSRHLQQAAASRAPARINPTEQGILFIA